MSIHDWESDFWDSETYLPEGTKEFLQHFPAKPFGLNLDSVIMMPIDGDDVADRIYNWILRFFDSQEDPILIKTVMKHFDVKNDREDPFLYAAIFFEVTCFLQSLEYRKLEMPISQKLESEEISDLSDLFDATATFEKQSVELANTIFNWLDIGFSNEVYDSVMAEIDRVEAKLNLITTFHPNKNEIGVFGIEEYERLTLPPKLSARKAHEAVLYSNLANIFTMCIPGLAHVGACGLLSYFQIATQNDPEQEGDPTGNVKKLVERVRKSGDINKMFVGRYTKIIRSIEATQVAESEQQKSPCFIAFREAIKKS